MATRVLLIEDEPTITVADQLQSWSGWFEGAYPCRWGRKISGFCSHHGITEFDPSADNATQPLSHKFHKLRLHKFETV
jgi:hypothetical protein